MSKPMIVTTENQFSLIEQMDATILVSLQEKIQKASTIEEYREILTLRNEIINATQEVQRKSLELMDKKNDLFWRNIYKGVALAIGVGLFVSSFTIYSIATLEGGICFGTGLSALGITIYFPKI